MSVRRIISFFIVKQNERFIALRLRQSRSSFECFMNDCRLALEYSHVFPAMHDPNVSSQHFCLLFFIENQRDERLCHFWPVNKGLCSALGRPSNASRIYAYDVTVEYPHSATIAAYRKMSRASEWFFCQASQQNRKGGKKDRALKSRAKKLLPLSVGLFVERRNHYNLSSSHNTHAQKQREQKAAKSNVYVGFILSVVSICNFSARRKEREKKKG